MLQRTEHSSSRFMLILLWVLVLFVFIFGFVVSLLYQSKKRVDFIPKPPVIETFHANDLGGSIDQLSKKYPDLTLQRNLHGITTANHILNNGLNTVWFVDDNNISTAFRIRSRMTISAEKQTEILDELGDLYHRPFDVSCDGNTASTEAHCHYQWWIRESVTLDLFTKYLDQNRIQLSAVTTDTRLNLKHHNKTKSFLPQP